MSSSLQHQRPEHSVRLRGADELLQGRQAEAQLPELLLGELLGAARDDLPPSLGEGLLNRGVGDRRRDVAKGTQHPQTDGHVRSRVEADLVECRVHEPVEAGPRDTDAEDARRIVAQGCRLFPGGATTVIIEVAIAASTA